MDNLEYILCPFCSEEIKVKAIKCRHCQSTLDEESVAEIEKIRKEVFQNNVKHKADLELAEDDFNVEESRVVYREEPVLSEQGLSWSNGFYSGDIKNGTMHGHGVMVLPDGHRYEGEWCAGKRDGQGILTDPNRVEQSGFWLDDQFVGPEVEEERFYPEEEFSDTATFDQLAEPTPGIEKAAANGDDLIACPHCSGEIFAYALKCKYCGLMINNQ